jgi:hypothetical protein
MPQNVGVPLAAMRSADVMGQPSILILLFTS